MLKWLSAAIKGPQVGRAEQRAWGDSLADVLGLDRRWSPSTGIPVNDDQALRLGAVWGCVDLISELVATLPVSEYKRTGDRRVELPRPKLLDDPAGDDTGFEVWCRQLMMSLLMRGNGFGWVEAIGQDGWPTQIVSVHPDEMTPRRDSRAGPLEWFRDGKKATLFNDGGQLWHVPAYVMPGSPVGLSPIRYAAETIGVGLATQRFGGQWFRDGAHPTHVLETEHEITKDQAEVLKQRLVDSMRNNREPLALGLGMQLKAIQVSPEESQFLETMKANADDIARFFFRRPPGEGGQITYANVEARSLDLLTYTLNGWLVRVENALTRLRPRPKFVKFNADALIRVDLASRYRAHDTAIRAGWKSRNDVRRLEDEAPITDGTGDDYLWPPYTTTLPGDVAAELPSPNGDVPVPSTNGDTDAVPHR